MQPPQATTQTTTLLAEEMTFLEPEGSFIWVSLVSGWVGDNGVVHEGLGQLASVTGFSSRQHTMAHCAFRNGVHWGHMAYAELGLLAAGDELANVDALSWEEQLCFSQGMNLGGPPLASSVPQPAVWMTSFLMTFLYKCGAVKKVHRRTAPFRAMHVCHVGQTLSGSPQMYAAGHGLGVLHGYSWWPRDHCCSSGDVSRLLLVMYGFKSR